MNHDVFISYSSQNMDAAQAICHVLEQNDIRCWMAPRNIPPGSDYGDIIDDAIKTCKVVVVLFSETAAASQWVKGELNVAFEEQKTIIPFRLDKTPLKGQTRVMLSQRHWIDAYPDYKTKFNDLVTAVAHSIGKKDSLTVDTQQTKLGETTKIQTEQIATHAKLIPEKQRFKTTIFFVYIAAACFALLGYLTPNFFTDSADEDIVIKELVIDDSSINNSNIESRDHDMQNVAVEDSIEENTNIKEKERLLNDYLAKTEECCNKAEKKHGDYHIIQVLLDAKFYYYDKAQSLSKELYNKSLQPNQRLDNLVAKEFNYWVEQGNKVGKNKKNFKQKKTYYERAYKLRENKDIKARIEWLENQITKKGGK